jgi:hypothetical protein
VDAVAQVVEQELQGWVKRPIARVKAKGPPLACSLSYFPLPKYPNGWNEGNQGEQNGIDEDIRMH